MRKSSPAGLVVPVLVLALGAWGCSSGGGGGTGTAGGGRGGTTGGAGRGGTGGGTAGTGGAVGGTTGTGGATGGTTGTGGAVGGTTGTGGAVGGTTGTGGSTAGTGGVAGTGGGTAGTGGAPPVGTPAPNPPITGSATRPQLTAGTDYTILKYFEKAGIIPGSGLTTDNWDPTAGIDVSAVTPMFTVAATGGTHTTVQAALTAAIGVGGTARIYIKVEPGTYRETVCHRTNTPPITLYGTDAATTIIANNGYAGKVYTNPPPTDPPWNPCAATNPPATDANYGTSGSATAAFYARDFQAKNLTFSNDYVEVGTSNIQAVALMTQQDKMIFENVRVLGNQDSLYVKTGNVDTVQRVYFKNCYVEGDTDFIFGRATFVLDNCEIKYLGARRGATSGGYVVSPSTDFRNAYGLLIINSMFTSDGVPNAGTVYLGRAWDEGQASGGATYPTPGNVAGNTGGYPNGQVVIRNSVLGAHIAGAAPWTSASTTSRPYSSVDVVRDGGAPIPANRLWELTNTGAGAAP